LPGRRPAGNAGRMTGNWSRHRFPGQPGNRSGGVSGGRWGSIRSIGSAGSILSIGSAGSILSIGSAGSILSIGSAGSILSIGSAASAASILSAGSLASHCSVLSGLSSYAVLSWRSGHFPKAGKQRLAGVAVAVTIAGLALSSGPVFSSERRGARGR
jgi:hypothetical protein